MLLTVNQLRKANRAKDVAELLSMAKEENIEMTRKDAELFFGVLQKSKGLSSYEKGLAGGDACVIGHSCESSGENPLYGVGDRMQTMIITAEGPIYVKCELLAVTEKRLGDTLPEYAYLVKYLDGLVCEKITAGQKCWVWESHLKAL